MTTTAAKANSGGLGWFAVICTSILAAYGFTAIGFYAFHPPPGGTTGIAAQFMDGFRGLGQFMSGLAALSLVILGIFKLPGELSKSRGELKKLRKELSKNTSEQHKARMEVRIRRRSDEAAKILEAVVRFAGQGQAIAYLCGPFSFAGEGEDPKIENDRRTHMQKILPFRYERIAAEKANFYDAKIKAKIFFGSDANQIVQGIEEIWNQIQVKMRVLMSEAITRGDRREIYINAENFIYDVDSETRNSLNRLVDRLLEILKRDVAIEYED